MRGRGIQRNVHTFSALMNVCIKCGQYRLALEVYREMRGEVGRCWFLPQVGGSLGGTAWQYQCGQYRLALEVTGR